jgi:hypothetical protein
MIMALGALFPAAASAETLDISTLKCSDIIEMSPEDGAMLLAWIDGYLGEEGDEVGLEAGESMDDYCICVGLACRPPPDLRLPARYLGVRVVCEEFLPHQRPSELIREIEQMIGATA